LHEQMLQYLTDNPEIKLVFQPGMYHLMWGIEKMAPFYERAELVIMNREEAAQVTGKDRGDIKTVINGLHELGAKIAVVTDGPDGAYASDGSKLLFMPNYPDPAPPYDRTGAGDAFASTITAALALGESLKTALSWAPINSMSVVQKLGAQAGLLKKDEILRFLQQAPADYKASDFNG
jgi:sugar/nucleoside kinase (ribokinase family)